MNKKWFAFFVIIIIFMFGQVAYAGHPDNNSFTESTDYQGITVMENRYSSFEVTSWSSPPPGGSPTIISFVPTGSFSAAYPIFLMYSGGVWSYVNWSTHPLQTGVEFVLPSGYQDKYYGVHFKLTGGQDIYLSSITHTSGTDTPIGGETDPPGGDPPGEEPGPGDEEPGGIDYSDQLNAIHDELTYIKTGISSLDNKLSTIASKIDITNSELQNINTKLNSTNSILTGISNLVSSLNSKANDIYNFITSTPATPAKPQLPQEQPKGTITYEQFNYANEPTPIAAPEAINVPDTNLEDLFGLPLPDQIDLEIARDEIITVGNQINNDSIVQPDENLINPETNIIEPGEFVPGSGYQWYPNNFIEPGGD